MNAARSFLGKIGTSLREHPLILYGAAALAMLGFMVLQAGVQSFWLDELSLLGTITKDKSFREILLQYLRVDVTNLPLFPLAAALWYRLLPASDRLMLLLPCLASAAGCIFSALGAQGLFGKKAGVFTALLYAFNGTIVSACGLEFRAYAFLVLNVSLVIWTCFRRGFFGEGEKPAREIRLRELEYAFALFLLLFTHYMGAVFVLFLGLADLIFVLGKKTKAWSLLPYVFSGLPFSAWFGAMLLMKQKSIGSFWPEKPTLPQIARMVRYLLSGREAVFLLLLFSLFLLVYRLVCAFLAGEKPDRSLLGAAVLFWCSLGTVGAVFLYSAVLNPAGGFFVNRYFLVILPALLLLAGWGLSEGLLLLSGSSKAASELSFVAAAFLVFYIGLINFRGVREETTVSYEPFREAAAYVKELAGEELSSGRAAVVCTVNPRATAGFTEYYIRNGGREHPVAFVSLQGEDPLSALSDFDTLYFVGIHRDLSELGETGEVIREEFTREEWNEEYQTGRMKRKE